MHKKEMKLLVVGDEMVGKTTLITTIISEVPYETVRTLSKVVLPPDMCASARDVFTQLHDSCTATLLSLQSPRDYLSKFDLVLLVYDVSTPDSVQRISTTWLPFLSKAPQTSILLVGNKLDKTQNQQNPSYISVRELFKNFIKYNRQLQMGVQCSALLDKNVKKMLSSAQKAVLYPLTPLYDLATKQMTVKCKKALTRIFRILDSQLKGEISDKELITLQERVFDSELSGEDIDAIKMIIAAEDGKKMIDVAGFIAFHKKCIEMLKIQICWSILRYFNYSNSLQINPTDTLLYDAAEGASLQFEQGVTTYLTRLYSFAHRNTLPYAHISQKVFQCLDRIPLEEFKFQYLSMQAFITAWYLFAFIDYKQCFRCLLYTGYDYPLVDTFKRTRNKNNMKDLERLKEREVFSIVIVDDNQYTNGLFSNCTTANNVERTQRIVERKTKPCIFLLFRVQKEQLSTFFRTDPLAHKIDLLLHFGQISEVEGVSEHTMVRAVSQSEAEERMKVFDLSELDLRAVPIDYKPQHYHRLFDMILQTLEKIQLGFPASKILKLTEANNENTKFVYKVIGAVVFALATSALYLKFRK